MHRTHTCGELNATHIGQTVTLSGWVNKHRELGGLTFIDLRDRYGITQITFDPSSVIARSGSDAAIQDNIGEIVASLRPEYCIKVIGEVIARPDNMKNKNMATGEVELIASSIEILTKAPDVLPFPITDETNASEYDRFKYRYLDMRRKPVLDNVLFRAKMNQFARNWFERQGFVEVQTPIFTVSSPEGARDYLIPSRVNPGQFYALPQSPQQYKQLLMMGGLDKYFQIAPCFRDEDPRADRHSCEFYQFDVEMSFVEQEDIYKVVQGFVTDFVTTLTPNKKIKVHFERIAYHTAIDTYGSDKPDLRFGMQFVEMTQDFADSGFSVFADTVKNGGTIKAMKVDRVLTRKEIDALTDIAKQAGAKGLAYITFAADANGGIAKFFSEAELENIKTKVSSSTQPVIASDGKERGNPGDTHWIASSQSSSQGQTEYTVVFVADTYKTVVKSLDVVRRAVRDMFKLVNKDDLAFCFIEDFPFFEETDEGLDFAHNPFSFVKGGMDALKTKKPLELETTQYDLVCNGFEIMSGSIRNHDPEVMLKVFEMAGLGEQQIKNKFGAMYEAFQYSPPPHGGFAIGCDRFMMILKDEENIRECYAFPKSGRAQDVLMNAPGEVDEKQLEELGILNIDILFLESFLYSSSFIYGKLWNSAKRIKNSIYLNEIKQTSTLNGVDLAIPGNEILSILKNNKDDVNVELGDLINQYPHGGIVTKALGELWGSFNNMNNNSEIKKQKLIEFYNILNKNTNNKYRNRTEEILKGDRLGGIFKSNFLILDQSFGVNGVDISYSQTFVNKNNSRMLLTLEINPLLDFLIYLKQLNK